jgi:hypothetical protein
MDWAGVWLLEQRLVSREPWRRRSAERRWPPHRDRLGAVAVANGLAGAFDRARWLLVTESVVRAGGGIVWRHGEGGGVEIVLVQRLGYDDWSFPRASSTRARPRPRRPCARSKRRPGYAAAWA